MEDQAETYEHPPFALGGDERLTGEEPQFASLKDWMGRFWDDTASHAVVTRFAKHQDWGFVLRSFYRNKDGDGTLILWLDEQNRVNFAVDIPGFLADLEA